MQARTCKLSPIAEVRQYQILMQLGTKKQVKAYRDARFNAYPKSAQRRISAGREVRFGASAWNKFHRIGYKAAIKAGYKYHYVSDYKLALAHDEKQKQKRRQARKKTAGKK